MTKKLCDSPEIYCIEVPLPENPLRNLNSYVIKRNGASLIIDTGFNRDECRNALWSGLEELNIDLGRASLYLTHFHSDHTGLVWDFVNRYVPVYTGRVDNEFYHSYRHGRQAEMEQRFRDEGFPESVIAEQSTANQGRKYAPRYDYPVIKLEDGERLPFEDLNIVSIHTPGHTPGHTVLYMPEQQFLFSGDHILFDITPNIGMWAGIADPLADYISSLKAVKKLDIKATFPAHRGAGADAYQRIDQIIKHHGRRFEEILGVVAANQGITAYEIAGNITWSARGLGWKDFPPHQRWFAMSETLSHLTHLINTDKLISRKEDMVRYYLK